MTQIKHVGILNAYDARNRGDRAIVEAQLGWIERTMPGASVTIFSPHHSYNQTVFRSASCQAPLFAVNKQGNFLGRLLKPLLDIANHRLGTRTDSSSNEFQACDAFLVCGGGYLYSSPAPLASRQLFLHAANILAAQRTGKPVLSFPMSWGPIRKRADEWFCKRLASAMPILVNRGSESHELLASWGYRAKCVMLPDVVIAAAELLPGLKVWRNAPRQAGSLGIAPIDWGFDRTVDPKEVGIYIDKLVTIGKEWCRVEGRSITVFPQVEVDGTDDDRIISRRLLAALQEAGLPSQIKEDMEWSAYWQAIAAQDVFVGCRMHSCIFAMVCGVPTIGLGYQPKFRELFTQLELAERTHLIDSFSPSIVAEQLNTLTAECDRKEFLKHIDRAGQGLITVIDEAWRRTVKRCGPATPATDAATLISVVTPSFKQLEHLKCCSASVRDQEGDFRVEHFIHDGGSGSEFAQWAASQQGADCVAEKDDGMYDAINRGFRKTRGEIIAWLNCDEQYLPGTLEKVARFFEKHPEIDILFGDVILVDEVMTPLAYRRAVMPSLGHIQHSHLSTFSAATFVRRRVLDEGYYLRTRWKTIADAVWIEELLVAGYRGATLHEPLAVFCMLGSILGQSTLLFQERREWEQELGAASQLRKQWHIMGYRLQRLLVGAYRLRKVEISAYVPQSEKRVMRKKWVTGQWRVARNEAANLRAQREGTIIGLVVRVRSSVWTFIFALSLLAFAVFLDKRVVGDAVKGPFILLFSLMLLSFNARLRDLVVVVMMYFMTSWYLLNERPVDVRVVRLGTFSIGAALAVFWAAGVRNLETWIHSTLALIRKLPGPMILTNSRGKMILVNHSACTWLQFKEQDLLQKELHVLALADDGQAKKKLLIPDWEERPPDDLLGVALEHDNQTPVANARVFVIGKGKYRIYSFTLQAPSKM